MVCNLHKMPQYLNFSFTVLNKIKHFYNGDEIIILFVHSFI